MIGKAWGGGVSKDKKLNKEKVGGREVQMKVFTIRKKSAPETEPYMKHLNLPLAEFVSI